MIKERWNRLKNKPKLIRMYGAIYAGFMIFLGLYIAQFTADARSFTIIFALFVAFASFGYFLIHKISERFKKETIINNLPETENYDEFNQWCATLVVAMM